MIIALLAVTVVTGLVWRLAPLHLSPFAFKYGGSAVWAVAVYWVCAIFFPRWSSVRLAFMAATLALAVELMKLLYWPPLDRFRETLAGKLLLGRFFTLGAIAAYWIAIALVASIDNWKRAVASSACKPSAQNRGRRNTLGAATNPSFQVRWTNVVSSDSIHFGRRHKLWA